MERPRTCHSEQKRSRRPREQTLTAKTGKWCCSCQQYLPIEAFRPNPNNRNGIDSWCRPCHADAVRAWRARNGAEYNERRRQRYGDEHPLTTRPCAVCGEPMARPANVLVCGQECRRQRKREQRRTLASRDRAPDSFLTDPQPSESIVAS